MQFPPRIKQFVSAARVVGASLPLCALLLIEATEEQVHPMVEQRIGVHIGLQTRGALTLVDDQIRHRCGSLHRDASREESVSKHIWYAE